MTHLWAALLAASVSAPQDGGTVLKIGTEDVRIEPEFARQNPNLTAKVKIGGQTYVATEDGTLTWQLHQNLREWLSENPPVDAAPVRTLSLDVWVVRRAEVLISNPVQATRVQGFLEEVEIDRIKRSLASVLEGVRRSTGGKIAFTATLREESAPWRLTYRGRRTDFAPDSLIFQRANRSPWENASGTVVPPTDLTLVVAPDLGFVPLDERVAKFTIGSNYGVQTELGRTLGLALARYFAPKGSPASAPLYGLTDALLGSLAYPGIGTSQQFLTVSQAHSVKPEASDAAPTDWTASLSLVNLGGTPHVAVGWSAPASLRDALVAAYPDEAKFARFAPQAGWVMPVPAGANLLAISEKLSGGPLRFAMPGMPVVVPEPTPVAEVGGSFSAKLADFEAGPGLEIALDRGSFRGSIPISVPVKAPEGRVAIEFLMKSSAKLPFEIRFGSGRAAVGMRPTSAIGSRFAPGFVPDDQWHKVTLVMTDPGFGPITLSSMPAPTEWGSFFVAPQTLSIANITVRAATDSDPDPELIEDWPHADAFVQGFDLNQIKANLGSPDLNTRLSGLSQAATPRDLSLLPELVKLVRNGDWATSRLALEALSTLEAPEGEAIFKYGLELGPFDHNREAAAVAMPAQLGEKLVGPLSSAITSGEWTVRYHAAMRLSENKAQNAAVSLLVMLLDPEPTVRALAARSLDPKFELANRRLVFSAVNDPVESVRAAAYSRLIQSPIDDFRTQAYRGVRDESESVRVTVLETFSAFPKADQRAWIGQGLADPSPAVRAAAVRALIKQPAAVEVREVEHLVLDPYPAIRRAMQELARVKNLSFAWD